MTTITETITEKLLDAIQDPVGLQTVLEEYAHSKGPLYGALAQATTTLTKKLTTMGQEYGELGVKLKEREQYLKETEQKQNVLDQQIDVKSKTLVALEQKVQMNTSLINQAKNLDELAFGPGELEKLHNVLATNVPTGGGSQEALTLFFKFVDKYPHLAEVDGEVQNKENELVLLDGKLNSKQALLAEAKELGELGLGTKDLVKLHHLLVKFGASQGMGAYETLKVFFEYVDKFRDAVSLDTRIQQLQTAIATAKADTEQWQAQAKAAEAKTKARKSSIEITEKLIVHGVKERDLPKWQNILEKCEVSVDALSQELAQFASLEKLCQNRQQQGDKLETRVITLTAQVKALSGELNQVSASITAVRDKALAEVELTHLTIIENLQRLASETENYKKLQQEAAPLRDYLALAKAIKMHDPELWSQVSQETARGLMSNLLLWCKADTSHNPDMEPPTGSLAGKATFFTWYKVSLEEVLRWALTCL
jgi:outer membrane murein-binding lipoprotein Lpp